MKVFLPPPPPMAEAARDLRGPAEMVFTRTYGWCHVMGLGY